MKSAEEVHRAASWTSDQDKILTNMWKDGLTAAQISTALGARSRCAVIGRAHRLGLERHSFSNIPRKKEKPVIVPKPKPPPEPDAPKGPFISVQELTDKTCKWAMDESAINVHMFCGSPTVAGCSYCAYHKERGCVPAKE